MQEAKSPAAAPIARKIVKRTRGSTHGPVTLLMSPGDLGEQLKPFVFLDLFSVNPSAPTRFAIHPHSGLATLTALVDGEMHYSDRHGNPSSLAKGGMEWMLAGGGVWHGGALRSRAAATGFQLWVALPPALENAPEPVEAFLKPEEIPQAGPARVLLGSYEGVGNRVSAPSSLTYLHVTLAAGERWNYTPAAGHDVAWLALDAGLISAPDPIGAGELAVFAEGEDTIEIEAIEHSSFVLGSAAKHPYPLVTGYYSAHTNPKSLVAGEKRIAELGAELKRAGRI